MVELTGAANAATSKHSNIGIRLNGSTVTGSTLMIDGTGGGGINRNAGISIAGGSFEATTGNVELEGGSRATTSGAGNSGIDASRISLTAAAELEINGIGGGGKNKNYGIFFHRVIGTAVQEVNVIGNGDVATSGNGNQGAFLNQSDLSGDEGVMVAGTGGGGVNDNHGLRLVGGGYRAVNGQVVVAGTSLNSTTGSRNIGLYLLNGVRLGSADAALVGNGGGGSSLNHGIFANRRITVDDPTPILSSTAGAGDGSEQFAGDFFP